MKNRARFPFLSLVPLALLSCGAPLPLHAANLVWTGAFSNEWAFNGGFPITNWGGLLPDEDDTLIFPAGAANKAMVNNLTTREFHHLRFDAAGYSLSGVLTMSGSQFSGIGTGLALIEITHGAGLTELSLIQHADGFPVILQLTSAAAVLETGNLSCPVVLRGAGRLRRLSGSNSVDNVTFSVGNGSDSVGLEVLGSHTIGGDVTVAAGAWLRGEGNYGALTNPAHRVTLRGNLAPDNSLSPSNSGDITMFGSLECTSAASLFIEQGDRLIVHGPITAGTAKVHVPDYAGLTLGNEVKIIDHRGTDAITGTFRLPSGQHITEGLEINVGRNRLRFSYTGGDGNDFTATALAANFTGTREWDAGGSTRNFSEAANWTSNLLPTPSNALRFGTLAPELPLGERFPVNDLGGSYYRLEFTAGGYAIEESGTSVTNMTLTAGITASHDTDGVELDQDILLAGPQTFSLTGASFLRFGVSNAVSLGAHRLTLENTGTSDMRFNGGLTGTGGIAKTGPGLLSFAGAGITTMSGPLQVMEGELRLQRSSANGAVRGPLTIGGEGTEARVTVTSANQITDTVTVALNGRSTLRMDAADTITALTVDGGDTEGTGLLTLLGDVTLNTETFLRAPMHMDNTTGIRTWTVAQDASAFVFGALTDSGAASAVTQRKTGPGLLVLDGTAADTHFRVEAGTLEITGTTSSPGNGPSVTLQGGVLGGGGFAQQVLGVAGQSAEIHPSLGGPHAVLTCARLAAVAADTLTFSLGSAGTPGTHYDGIALAAGTSTGQVSLGSARLRLLQSAPVVVGTTFIIVDNDGTDAVSGTFSGLAQGARIATAQNLYTVSYTGGTGNDVTLTAVNSPEIVVEQTFSLPSTGTFQWPATKVREASELTFTIRNTGTSVLNLSASPRVQLSGTDAALFSVTQPAVSSIAAGGSTTFRVRFAPVIAGEKVAALAIPNNDFDEAPFVLDLKATAAPSPLVTNIAVTRGNATTPGTVNLTLTGSLPDSTMRLEASSNLTSWTLLRTFQTDSFGDAVTGASNDPGNLGGARRFYRAVLP